MLTMSERRIYVACLAAYNNGILHGEWIDADQSAEELQEAVSAMLSRSPIAGAEEFAIHDYEGIPGLGEYTPLAEVAEMAAFLSEHGEAGEAALKWHCGRLEDAIDAMENGGYQGRYDSDEDFVQQMFEDCGVIPADARDVMMDYYEQDGHYFHSR